MIELIIFDLDDTLYNERDFVMGGFAEVCKYLSYKYADDFSMLMNEIQSILKDNGRGRVFNDLCKNHNYSEDIKHLVQIYREGKPKLKLYEDSEFIINKLSGKYKLGIITDGIASVQWNKIKLLNLENIFDKIIVTDDLGKECWKPCETPYIKMLEYFKIGPNNAVYVGDNPNKDFIGARKVGMKTIRIIRKVGDHKDTRLSKEYEADTEILNMKEVLEFLKEEE